jgi:hypothetical protein
MEMAKGGRENQGPDDEVGDGSAAMEDWMSGVTPLKFDALEPLDGLL